MEKSPGHKEDVASFIQILTNYSESKKLEYERRDNEKPATGMDDRTAGYDGFHGSDRLVAHLDEIEKLDDKLIEIAEQVPAEVLDEALKIWEEKMESDDDTIHIRSGLEDLKRRREGEKRKKNVAKRALEQESARQGLAVPSE